MLKVYASEAEHDEGLNRRPIMPAVVSSQPHDVESFPKLPAQGLATDVG